jgi:shikimate kinase
MIHARYCDLDSLVEKQQGKSCRELYTKGAEIFRKAECAALFSALDPGGKKSALVLSCGGGLCDNAEALEALKAARNRSGSPKLIIIAMETSADTAWERIRKGGKLPPFLQTDDPKETHRELHERRTALYRSLADVALSVDGRQEKDVAEELREIVLNR